LDYLQLEAVIDIYNTEVNSTEGPDHLQLMEQIDIYNYSSPHNYTVVGIGDEKWGKGIKDGYNAAIFE